MPSASPRRRTRSGSAPAAASSSSSSSKAPTRRRGPRASATRTSSTTPVGLPIGQLVGALGGGLLTVVVDAGGPPVDDVTLAEPASGVFGQAGDLLLGVGVERPGDAAALVEGAAAVDSGAVVLRRSAARNQRVRTAAARFGVSLVELADHASWAHVVWLLRGVLDRAASGPAVRAGEHDDTPGCCR